MTLFLRIGIILLFFLTACNTRVPSRVEGMAMTMCYCVQIGDPNPDLKKIEAIILNTFNEIDQIYNNWNPHSEISKLNALPAREARQLSLQLATFLKQVGKLVRLTEGRFDPTVAPVKQKLLATNVLDSESPVGWDNIHLEGDIFWKQRDGVSLDLGGVAKGYAVDLLIERLQKAGCHHLYVEWGGEIRTAGKHPQGRPWKIAIFGGETLDLEDEAIATSGNYLQRWTIEGNHYTHIIDPTTKFPLELGPIKSVSVISKSCFEADALATALMLFPSFEEAQKWAKEHNLKIFLH